MWICLYVMLTSYTKYVRNPVSTCQINFTYAWGKQSRTWSQQCCISKPCNYIVLLDILPLGFLLSTIFQYGRIGDSGFYMVPPESSYGVFSYVSFCTLALKSFRGVLCLAGVTHPYWVVFATSLWKIPLWIPECLSNRVMENWFWLDPGLPLATFLSVSS